jgi:hypothetical protein
MICRSEESGINLTLYVVRGTVSTYEELSFKIDVSYHKNFEGESRGLTRHDSDWVIRFYSLNGVGRELLKLLF